MRSFVSSREVLAMPALGADHVTVGPTLLEDLTSSDRLPRFHKGLWKVPTTKQMDAPGFAWEDWIPPLPSRTADHTARVTSELSECQLYSSNVDYLADGVLDKLNNDDEITRDLLQDALAQFISWESKSQRHIESLQAKHALI